MTAKKEETKAGGSFKVTDGNQLKHNGKLYTAGNVVPVKELTKDQADNLVNSGMLKKG